MVTDLLLKSKIDLNFSLLSIISRPSIWPVTGPEIANLVAKESHYTANPAGASFDAYTCVYMLDRRSVHMVKVYFLTWICVYTLVGFSL